MICTQASCVMIYHYSVMDKKKTAISYQYCSLFLARREGFEPPETLASTVFKTAVIDHSTISAQLIQL